MACPKTSKCGCPGVRCMIPQHCRGITQSVCRKPSRKPVKSRRRKSACKYGVKKSGGCKKKPGAKRSPRRKSKSRRKSPKRKSKSRRKSSPKRKSKSRRKSPKRKSKSRRKSPKRKSKSRRKSPKRKSKSRRKSPKRKSPGAGWSKLAPNSAERTTMLKKCGKKCFLGPDKSFPICAKGTCKVNDKGLHAAYVRAKQWGGSPQKYKGKSKPTMSRSAYQKIARSAKSRLVRRGYAI